MYISPFLYLFHNFINIIGVSDPEFIRLIVFRLLQHTNPVYISIKTYEIMCDYLQSLLWYTHKVQLISIHLLYTYEKNQIQDFRIWMQKTRPLIIEWRHKKWRHFVWRHYIMKLIRLINYKIIFPSLVKISIFHVETCLRYLTICITYWLTLVHCAMSLRRVKDLIFCTVDIEYVLLKISWSHLHMHRVLFISIL